MGEIRIGIPKDMERAFEAAFPGEDKAAVVLRVIQADIARRLKSDPGGDVTTEEPFDGLVAEVLRLRDEPPYFTDEEIRRAREELRG